MSLSEDILVRRKTFTMFIEAILSYSLADAILAGPAKGPSIIKKYQVQQNNFLRAVSRTSDRTY